MTRREIHADGSTPELVVTSAPQREAWRQGAMPPVERLDSGIWSVPVPMPMHPLRYVLCYVVESQRGPVLVDPGWPADVSWEALVSGLGVAGCHPQDVHGVLISHAHTDHHGLADRLREVSGCWIGMHPRDSAALEQAADGSAVAHRNGAFLEMAGVPVTERKPLLIDSAWLRSVSNWHPDRTVHDHDSNLVPGRLFEARWTPGHTPGHLCFVDRAAQVVLTGDHLLPRITPHIGTYSFEAGDALGDYLTTLDETPGWPDVDGLEALPGHEYRFRGLRARALALRAHHDERLEQIHTQVLELGRPTLWDVARGASWSRTWSETTGSRRRLALAETLAHLRRLEEVGKLRRHRDTPVTWTAVDNTSARLPGPPRGRANDYQARTP